ncbi:adenosylcobinamide-phosphate synthase CbiB [Clostridium septicum]|uniref:Cobalamin biosynthesis protein CobD n=1 Tax=Clostridium septicum TaxID=1504 RepID=A0A9N7JMW7_CLOSE|nr:adenosylcobinamide-phosphate synthase CbiB [Clostridium septicum]AYE35260.1 cobalamin biosynthesis protein [Clostridium septicum]MDU1313683.1 adenosylcobinamide-phosphate synthase CbiB [Clostridium septicum]QAS60655.1 cobalamin biosynthesis protein [Clostridium septicum]UEC20090.1 adenosylcobinamide-phosphate synthase CbiB [Clostridium septicum]USS01854.1 adenosylcobinamide-phosphate synthase CbiB [Clostridium septicum]
MIDLTIGFLLDLIIGDPQNPIHPVRIIGNLCRVLENFFRSIMKKYLKLAGLITWIIVVLAVYFINYIIIKFILNINIVAGVIFSGILIYFCISAKGLKVEGLKVYNYLIKNDIECARKQLSYIVGRDTKSLDKKGIIRAVVETIAENMSDGVIAPLFYAGIGGAPLAMAYKAVNTMDSMFGYKNDKYMEFGFFPAKLDDVFNYIPARITGLLTVLTAFILKLNWKNSFKIYNRDKYNHTSPNSAHPEAAVAGALGIKLGGANYYFGKLVEKPTIGDKLKEIELSDIDSTNKILYGVAILGYILGILINLIWRLL